MDLVSAGRRLRGALRLPDPLAAGVALSGLPGAGATAVIVPFTGGWPARRAIRLVVEAGQSGAPALPRSTSRTPADVHAPKASVTTPGSAPGSSLARSASSSYGRADGDGGVTPAVRSCRGRGHICSRRTGADHRVRDPQPLHTRRIVHTITASRARRTPSPSAGTSRGPAETQRADVAVVVHRPLDDGPAPPASCSCAQCPRSATACRHRRGPTSRSRRCGTTSADTKHHSVY